MSESTPPDTFSHLEMDGREDLQLHPDIAVALHMLFFKTSLVAYILMFPP